MSNTVTVTKIVDGHRNVEAHVYVLGDGSGQETDKVLLDASALAPAAGELMVYRIQGYLRGGWTAVIEQDGTTDAAVAVLPADDLFDFHFPMPGVGPEIATAPTGDVTMTTASLGSGDDGVFTIWAKKVPS